ncbi:MAG: peptidase U32 family protein, partial [Candidatus Woesearchaeota archaeon]
MKMEIMAPVGDFETLQSAIKAGTDSVYFGIGDLNMRSRAAINFTIDDLKEVVRICKENKVKTYLALNIVLYDDDLVEMKATCDAAKEAGISAMICSDFAAIEYAKSIGLEVHVSTQANVSNLEAVKFFSKYVDVAVLARELSMEQIKEICEQIKKQKIKGPSGNLIEIEIFVHGALCVSISGKCYMSLANYNSSANRGACFQPCRRAYKVIDEETGDELKVDNKYVMSPKDLCTIGFLDRIVDSGVKVLKIEGRGRKAEYVYNVVKVYKEALKAIEEGNYNKENIEKWTKELEKVYNRGFWHGGYYLGKKLGEWSGAYGSQATTEKVYVGKGVHYFGKKKVAHFLIESDELKIGDSVIITGPTTGYVEFKVTEMKVEDKKVEKAVKGNNVTFPLNEKIRENDKLFVVRK